MGSCARCAVGSPRSRGKSVADQMMSAADDYIGVQPGLPRADRGQVLSMSDSVSLRASDGSKTLAADMIQPEGAGVRRHGDPHLQLRRGRRCDKDGKVTPSVAKSTRVYAKVGGKWLLVHANFAPGPPQSTEPSRAGPLANRALFVMSLRRCVGTAAVVFRTLGRESAGNPFRILARNPSGSWIAHALVRRHPGRRPGQAHEVGPAQGAAAPRRPPHAVARDGHCAQLGAEAIHIVYGHGGERVQKALAAETVDLGAAGRTARHRPCGEAGHAGHAGRARRTGPVRRRAADAGRRPCSHWSSAATAKRSALLTVRLDDPTGYGRIVRDTPARSRASSSTRTRTRERAIDEVNTGLMAAPARACASGSPS